MLCMFNCPNQNKFRLHANRQSCDNCFHMVDGAKHLAVGDLCKAEAHIISVINANEGKIVKVKGFVYRQGQGRIILLLDIFWIMRTSSTLQVVQLGERVLTTPCWHIPYLPHPVTGVIQGRDYLGRDSRAGELAFDQEKANSIALQAKLDSITCEHGDTYIEGIQPRFDILKTRHFDSSWNWVCQDALLMWSDIIFGRLMIVDHAITARCIALLIWTCPSIQHRPLRPLQGRNLQAHQRVQTATH